MDVDSRINRQKHVVLSMGETHKEIQLKGNLK